MISDRFRRLGGNVFWLIANRMARMVVSVVVLGAVSRHLGVSQFGLLNYGISIAAIFSTVASLGFEGIVIRKLVQHPDKTSVILCTSFWMRLIGGIGAIGLVAAVSVASRDTSQGTLLCAVVSLGFLPGAMEVLELWFQKNILAKHTVKARVGSALVAGAMRLGLVASGASIMAFAWMQAIEAALAAAALVWVYRLHGETFREWRFDGACARRIFRECWPLILSGVLVAVYFRVEQFLVKRQLGDFSVGIYYASVRVVEMWGFIPTVILATVYPILVEKHASGSLEDRDRRLQLIFDVLTGMGFLVAISVTGLAPLLVPVVFGAEFAPAAHVLMIHAWMAPVMFSACVRSQYMLLEDATVYHTFAAAMGIAINIPLTLVLMRFFDANGAAMAVVATSWFTGFGSSFLFKKIRPCGTFQARALLVPVRWRLVLASLKQLK
jgi:O-antigen/teichoic acid export membrane protein